MNDCSVRVIRSCIKIFVQEILVQVFAYENYFTTEKNYYGSVVTCAVRFSFICFIDVCSTLFSNQSTGRWSSSGIIQDNDHRPPVICRATHLTSFSVLVSSVDADEVGTLN